MLVNQYFQFADPIGIHLRKTRNVLQDYPNQNIIITADVNAKPAMWHCASRDAKREEVEMLIAECDLEVIIKRITRLPIEAESGHRLI